MKLHREHKHWRIAYRLPARNSPVRRTRSEEVEFTPAVDVLGKDFASMG